MTHQVAHLALLSLCSCSHAAACAQEADVVQISGDSAPPVCRLVAIDKYKYELAKNDRDAKRKQREAR